jgi:hypothetical protein
MTKRPAITPVPLDGEVEASMLRFKRSFEAHVATIKGSLAQWLCEHRSDSTATRIALLEIVFDGYLFERTTATSDLASAVAEATDIVQAVLRGAVQRRRAALHMSASRTSQSSAIPINDEEVANRLTELLKLLDAVAEPLPTADALRQTIDDAAEPLGLLLGYFAAGIDQPASSHTTAQRKAKRLRPPPGSAPTPAQAVSSPSPDVESRLRRPVPFEVEEWS